MCFLFLLHFIFLLLIVHNLIISWNWCFSFFLYLLKYRSEFLKVQEDLNVAKERDKEQYYNIVERLRDMYRESGAVSFLPDLPYALI
jgi:hypothetical protein